MYIWDGQYIDKNYIKISPKTRLKLNSGQYHILKVYDLKSELLELDENIKFDLIISNFGFQDIKLSYDERMNIFNTDPLEYFVEKLNNSEKLVSTISFDTLTKNHHLIFEMIYNDCLELITRIDMSGTDSDLVMLSINKGILVNSITKFH